MYTSPFRNSGVQTFQSTGLEKRNCWGATDKHFECMDQFVGNSKYENQYNCPETLKGWVSNCGAKIRKNQLLYREMNKRDKKLYTQDRLTIYNEEKNLNKRSWMKRMMGL